MPISCPGAPGPDHLKNARLSDTRPLLFNNRITRYINVLFIFIVFSIGKGMEGDPGGEGNGFPSR
jgi:hypothetical protein